MHRLRRLLHSSIIPKTLHIPLNNNPMSMGTPIVSEVPVSCSHSGRLDRHNRKKLTSDSSSVSHPSFLLATIPLDNIPLPLVNQSVSQYTVSILLELSRRAKLVRWLNYVLVLHWRITVIFPFVFYWSVWFCSAIKCINFHINAQLLGLLWTNGSNLALVIQKTPTSVPLLSPEW